MFACIFPMPCPECLKETEFLTDDCLTFVKDGKIFQAIHALQQDAKTAGRTIPGSLIVNTYGPTGKIEISRYTTGRRLFLQRPEDFSNISKKRNIHPYNKAILAFIKALPADTPLLLFQQ